MRRCPIPGAGRGALLNAAIGRYQGKGGDEKTLLRSIQEAFEPGDIVLGDAYFATYFFIAAMQAKGVDILMEQNGSRRRSTDFRQGRRLGPRDHVIVIDYIITVRGKFKLFCRTNSVY